VVNIHRVGAIADDSQCPLDVVHDTARRGLRAAHVEGVVAAVALDLGGAAGQSGPHVEHIGAGVGATQEDAVVGGAVAERASGGRVIDVHVVGGACKTADLAAGHHHVAVGRAPAKVADDQTVGRAGPGVHGQGAGDGVQVTAVGGGIGRHVDGIVP